MNELITAIAEQGAIANLDTEDQHILLAWCQSHDWGRNAQLDIDGRIREIYGIEEVSIVEGFTITRHKTFDNAQNLINWAGY